LADADPAIQLGGGPAVVDGRRRPFHAGRDGVVQPGGPGVEGGQRRARVEDDRVSDRPLLPAQRAPEDVGVELR
jgi:hypothetical protein